MARAKPISAAMLARSHGVGEPRWSPGGQRLAWLDSWNGRTDVVVAPTAGDRPPRVVTADFAVTPAGAYGGGGYCWISDDELAVAGADGHLAVVSAEGGVVRVVSRDGAALAPAASPDGSTIAFSIDRDDACDIALVAVDGSDWPRRISHADYAWDATWSPDGTNGRVARMGSGRDVVGRVAYRAARPRPTARRRSSPADRPKASVNRGSRPTARTWRGSVTATA